MFSLYFALLTLGVCLMFTFVTLGKTTISFLSSYFNYKFSFISFVLVKLGFWLWSKYCTYSLLSNQCDLAHAT